MKSVRTTALTTAVGIALFGITASTGLSAAGFNAVQSTSSAVRASATGRYIVTFTEAGLVDYQGGIAGLARTAPEANLVSAHSSRKLDAHSSAADAYKSYLAAQRSQYISSIEQALGRAVTISFTYDVTRNGISVALSPSEAAAVGQLPGVVSVAPVQIKHTDTFRGPTFIGANTIWDGTQVPSYAMATRGQGVKIGVIDTGTNSVHPSFANDPTCGFSEANPKLHPRDCNSNDGTVCTGTNPEAGDGQGHGVHTSSTAGGNTIDNTYTPAPLLPDGISMSGVAPCAEVYPYKVANNTGGISDDAITAAIQNAIVDQVDAVNFSIGPTCGGGDPWQDSLDFLDAENADVFVAASAGNTRTNCTNPTGLVANNGPWMLTVAASTQDEVLASGLQVTGPGTVPANIQNIEIVAGSTTGTADTTALSNYPLRADPDNLSGCNDTGGFPAHYFDGSIAVVRRGFQAPGTVACSFVEKVTNAANAGATMVVIANNQNQTLTMDTTGTTIPSFVINTLAESDALLAFVTANQGPAVDADVIFANGFETMAPIAVGNYERGAIFPVPGDVLAGFSFRGPTPAPYDNLTKPDITGPGVNIYAAFDAATGSYGLDSGTSMSSPHLAGSAALVRAVQPDWTPMEVKSALQTTATLTGFKEDGVTQWGVDDVGSGRVDLSKATRAGLTLDETHANFIAANPSNSTLPIKDLNLASLRNTGCGASCTWTRTFKNRLHASGTWTPSAVNPAGYTLSFSPATFTVAAGATQALTITATATGTPGAALTFGRVDLHETANQSPDQHLTVAVKGGTVVPPTGFCNGGVCNLQIDGLPASGGSFNSLGGGTSPFTFLWLNEFTPDAGEYPITLSTVDTIFSSTSTTIGDVFDLYIFQDNDTNPANGATLVKSVTGLTITTQNALQTITIPGNIVLTGPGDVLIALVNRTVNAYPAGADDGVAFANKSWVGGLGSVGSPPDLSTLSMTLTTAVLPTFTHNWIIRGHGTNGGGRPLTLDSTK